VLIKNQTEVNTLTKIFGRDGFALYGFKSRGAQQFHAPSKPDKERLVFALKGSIKMNETLLQTKDMAYVPLGTDIEVEADAGSITYVAEASGAKRYDPYIKKYKEAQRLDIGQPTFRRTVIVVIGEGDPTNSFLAGYVENSLGEWSSYPPHKHDDKPEAYIYYGIDPGFAVQLIMDEKDEKAYVVHDYDTVFIPRGYHPHVNTSLTGSNYAWVISAPFNNRNLGVTIHPAFKEIDLGRSHLRVN
jgi:5-deoxy-glucuronate isomerase